MKYTKDDIILRAPEPSDVDRLYIWENTPEMWPFGSFMAPMSRHQLWEYVRNYDANPLASGQLRLIIDFPAENRTETTSAGIIDLYDIDAKNSRAFVGIMIAPIHRRKGIARGALEKLDEYCLTCLGLRLLAAEVASDNQPSLNLFTSAGYSLTGRRPSWFRRGNSFVSCTQFQKQLLF